MSTEIAVLRALLRLSHRRGAATLEDLLAGVSRDAPAATLIDVQRALASLARSQLVQRQGETARLSLAGLAVAVAADATEKAARKERRRVKTASAPASASAPPARIFPLVRRHRAA